MFGIAGAAHITHMPDFVSVLDTNNSQEQPIEVNTLVERKWWKWNHYTSLSEVKTIVVVEILTLIIITSYNNNN